ncbi:patatin-like phospholipase family protein [Ruegeria meonggei]|uniref:patatin-like phospholipase family protein n=1 Tax=Ruegeria meonggei TaxID=1446476 RepID=UPI00366FEA19
MKETREAQSIAIALSGGGARAIAFHLGCLKALHQTGILQRSKTLSCVSGGSVIGAMYVAHEGSFESFEDKICLLLEQGLVSKSIKTAFTTSEGLKAVLCSLVLLAYRILQLISLPLYWVANVFARQLNIDLTTGIGTTSPRRFASRTTILERTLDKFLFEGKTLKDLENAPQKFVSVAAELRTGSAFYFTPGESGCWRFGKVNPGQIKIARAVTASAAYPIFLPALDEVFAFNRRDGSVRSERVTLTDGGVYDNLGLSPLWPDRDPKISVDIPVPNVIITCRAGYGLRFGRPANSMVTRMTASFYTIFDRSQNAALKRLYDLKSAGRLKAIVLPYIGQADDRLTHAPANFIKRDEVSGYPTNFGPMSKAWIDKLSKRGQQVTLAVLQQHNPELISEAI